MPYLKQTGAPWLRLLGLRLLVGIAVAGAAAPGMAAKNAPPAKTAVPAPPPAPNFPAVAIGPERDQAKPNIIVIDSGGTLTSRARDRSAISTTSAAKGTNLPRPFASKKFSEIFIPSSARWRTCPSLLWTTPIWAAAPGRPTPRHIGRRGQSMRNSPNPTLTAWL